MTIKECYQEIGDYEEILSRFYKEERIKKFVLKFLDDKSFELLCESIKNQDYKEAFRASHTLKGICQNLSFTKLYQSCFDLTELLRNNQNDGIDALFQQVKNDYFLTIDTIKKLN